jgi:hypothetical protein
MFTRQVLQNFMLAFSILNFFSLSPLHATADFIIFSYDRPMQLYAVLESAEHYLTGVASTTVIYRTSDKRFENGYQLVKKQFPYVQFICQGVNPKADFKLLVLQAFKAGTSHYILFAPDDIIVKNYADLDFCIQKMEEYRAYGFYLRLGTHLDRCYTQSISQPIPPLTSLADNLYAWTFKDGTGDWKYPNNVDMTIYRKKEILDKLEANSYSSPNTMESLLARYQDKVIHRTGLCFGDSVIVNVPVNLIQEDWINAYMHSWTPLQLLELFESGKKIDISKLAGIQNKSCHIDFEFTFIDC